MSDTKNTEDSNSQARPRIEIYDTTLRDGSQAQGVSFSLQDKLLIAEALDRLGVDFVEGGYPLSNPKDEAFFVEARKKSFKHLRIAAFGMTRRKGIKAADDDGMKALLGSGAPVITIVGKSSEMQIREVLGVSEAENLDMISDSLELMVSNGREAIFDAEHFFDGYAGNADFAIATLKRAVQAGATRLVLCDTNGGSTLEHIAAAVRAVTAAVPGVRIGVHCHNDCGLAVANSIMAVRCGATHVQGTINGIGERCGNADLTAVIGNLAIKYGYDLLQDGTLSQLTETSRFIYEVANLNLQENQPFVGASAFAHKGGMHVHAVRKNTSTYEHMSPEAVGNSRRILVSELSGVSNIAATVPAKFSIAGDRAAQKKILSALMELENQGYQFEAAEASFDVLVRKTLGQPWYRKLWALDHYRCMIMRKNGGEAATEATVKVELGDQVEHCVAEGNGPVDSLKKALSAALRKKYVCVDDLHLVDYKVRVVNTAAETAAKVRVVIDWHDNVSGAYFGSVGVSENIIDASWLALVDAMEYKVLMSLDGK